jgi:hypothetical protein
MVMMAAAAISTPGGNDRGNDPAKGGRSPVWGSVSCVCFKLTCATATAAAAASTSSWRGPARSTIRQVVEQPSAVDPIL